MEFFQKGWGFFQNEVLGMHWLNRLIGSLLESMGADISVGWGGGLHFFVYDTIKIFVLLAVLIFGISYIQSYFPPERTKRILGRFRGLGANSEAALLGTVLSFMMAVTTLSLPSLIMLRKAIQPKLLAAFIGIVTAGIILCGYFFNLTQGVLL